MHTSSPAFRIRQARRACDGRAIPPPACTCTMRWSLRENKQRLMIGGWKEWKEHQATRASIVPPALNQFPHHERTSVVLPHPSQQDSSFLTDGASLSQRSMTASIRHLPSTSPSAPNSSPPFPSGPKPQQQNPLSTSLNPITTLPLSTRPEKVQKRSNPHSSSSRPSAL